ncbi:hypothetical protein [Leptospira interrogans]|uniref:hypothetical protein n=2 Tax=Leptospira interrogans TaxID=173 RepID=UPI0007737725|nr:hypothetical protein [Leptospira interrogans]MCR8640720.1 hypothetical protein [Leptospira interrogans serovar Ricardi]
MRMDSSVVAYFENCGVKIWQSVCIEWQFDSNEIPYGSDSFYYETNPRSYFELFNLKSNDTSFVNELPIIDVNTDSPLRLNAV